MKNNLYRIIAFVMAVFMIVGMAPQTALHVSAEGATGDPYAALAGKKLSILGDSISTFKNWSDGDACTTANSTLGAANWHYNGERKNVLSADDTWWKQAADQLGMEVLVNNSWSGSFVSATGSEGAGYVPAAYLDRCVQLHADVGENAGQSPDVIAFYMGTNDFYRYGEAGLTTLPMGSAEETLAKESITEPETVMDAYAICLQKMEDAYPDAQIYCFTLLPAKDASLTDSLEAFNEDIAQLGDAFGATVVDLYNCGITADNFSTMMGDDLHPNDKGMDAITAAFRTAVQRNAVCDYSEHGTHEGWTVWDDNNKQTITEDVAKNGGKIVFNAGGRFSNTINLAANKELTICLHGQAVTTGVNVTFKLNEGSKLTICDCTAKTAGGVYTAGSIKYNSSQSAAVGSIVSFNAASNFVMYDGILNGDGKDNSSAQGGGLIHAGNGGNVSIYGGVLKSYTGYNGGAIYVSGNSVLNLSNMTISGCQGSAAGGAIYADAATVTLDGVTISGCSAPNSGAIHSTQNSTVQIRNSVITNCTATNNGGMTYANGSAMTISNTDITGCSAKNGGAIFTNNNGHVTVNGDSVISGCSATTEGGAIYTYLTTVDLANVHITECGATRGAAIYAHTATVNIQDGTEIDNCTASGDGGAVFAANYADINIFGGAIHNNNAVNGGAVKVNGTGAAVDVTGGTFTKNTASEYGGVVDLENGAVTIDGLTVTENTGKYGGVLSVRGGQATMKNSTFTQNHATWGGGVAGTYNTGTLLLENVTMTGNTAGTSAGALYVQNTRSTTTAYTTLKGKVVIKDNHLTTAAKNYPSNVTLASCNRVLAIQGLSAESQIGVNTCNSKDHIAKTFKFLPSGATEADAQYFFSDEGHDITFASNALSITVRTHSGTDYHANDGTITAWGGSDYSELTTLPSEGTYYLQTDIYLDTKANLEGKNLILCLNGYSVYANPKAAAADSKVFRLSGGSNVTICDCSAHEDTDGEYLAGKLIPGTGVGGVVSLYPNRAANTEDTIFTLRDGIIDGTNINNATSASAIQISHTGEEGTNAFGVVHITGGEIRNCTALANGAAVNVSSGGTLNISGGKLTNNQCAVVLNNGTLNISGKPVITGNKVNGVEKNIYLSTASGMINMSDLAEGAQVGVSAARTIEDGQKSRVAVVTDNTYKAGMLYSDVESRKITDDQDGATELYLMALAVAAEIDGKTYYDPIEAIKAAGADDLVKLNQNITALELTEDLQLDLNGYNITGEISGDVTLYLIDSQTNDYTVEDGNYGKITGDTTGVDISKWHKIGGRYYAVVTEEDGSISAHRVYAAVTAKALRPNSTGIGFQARFASDEVIQKLADGFGMDLTVKNGDEVLGNVVLDAKNDGSKELNRDASYVFAIKDFLLNTDTVVNAAEEEDQQALIDENNARANYTIVGTPYILLKGEDAAHDGTGSEVTFKSMVTKAYENFGSYDGTKQAALNNMYTTFSKTMSNWELNNIGK